MPRRYNMERRRQASEELRRRIVEATSQLHQEKGILGTSIQDIAERADVAPKTVYRYFPTYNDAVRACGQHVFELVPPPDEQPILAAPGAAERVAAFAEHWFAFYETAEQGIEIARRAMVMPAVTEQIAALERQRERQVGLVLAESEEEERFLLSALTTFDSWRSFKAGGVSSRDAAGIVVRAVLQMQCDDNTQGSSAGSELAKEAQ